MTSNAARNGSSFQRPASARGAARINASSADSSLRSRERSPAGFACRCRAVCSRAASSFAPRRRRRLARQGTVEDQGQVRRAAHAGQQCQYALFLILANFARYE